MISEITKYAYLKSRLFKKKKKKNNLIFMYKQKLFLNYLI